MEFARFVRSLPTPTPPPPPIVQPLVQFNYAIDLGPGYAYCVVVGGITVLTPSQAVKPQQVTVYPNFGFTGTYSYPTPGGHSDAFLMEVGVVSASPNSTLTIYIFQHETPAFSLTVEECLVLGSTTNPIQPSTL